MLFLLLLGIITDFILFIVQRKKFVDESKSLMEQISKLEELLSSKKHILQVDIVKEYRVYKMWALGY